MIQTVTCSLCKMEVLPAITEIHTNRYECGCHTWRLVYDKEKKEDSE